MWMPDVLDGFEQLTLDLEPDEEGDVVATLARRIIPGDTDAGVDLLYVHGWNDYFFQAHLADFWEGLGVRFHALDLRKYGRSIRDGQTPNYVADLGTYDEDIAAALAAIGHGTGGPRSRRLVLMGHSTGGLTLSLWASRHPGRAVGVVLNAPWLELQMREAGRRVLEPGVRAAAAINPRGPVAYYDRGLYSRAISAEYDGEWSYDSEWRSDLGRPPTPAWMAAILRGHDQVAHGLAIDAPVLVLLSARSTMPTRWTEDTRRTDTVLDVIGVARRVPNLGPVTTLVWLDGALHDVTLSAAPVREMVWRETARWFRGYVTADATRRETIDDTPPNDPWWRRAIAGVTSRRGRSRLG
ncbi:alpha/beta hydrolase [Myceligenerans xiligouense]|uniref:Alpha-beta hydrolase superfamily lysophospholipase n=1 Tax=Myceligenerans xiligouense TaxID=253184 RepID=A0A3N4ZUG0_9MICO|nr:alpha/beta hydrolase [Myceligenerans xiligouense]RPF23381.1 alpha-beta hydrolase superfamily lysophospholipase [Myceligenerans xiligouense]